MKQVVLFILALVFAVGCNNLEPEQSDGHGHDHGSEDVKLEITEYTNEFELFAEAGLFVKGKPSEILAHFTTLPDFDPLTEGSITASLIIGKNGIRQTIEEPIKPGIYRFVLKPEVNGAGQLIFDIKTKDGKYKVKSEIVVYSDLNTAEHIAEKKQVDAVNAINFTKEQSWKIDFATVYPEQEKFGKVIKTTAQILPEQTSETIVNAKTNGVVKLSGNLLAGQELNAGNSLMIISGKGLANENMEVQFLEAKNNYEVAKNNYERKSALSNNQIVSEREVEDARAKFENAKAVYNNLKDNFNEHGQVVSSPRNGVVKHVYVANGQYVEAGDPLFSLVNKNKLLVQAQVQQKDYPLLNSISSFNLRSFTNDKLYTAEDLNGMLLSYGKNIDEDEGYLLPVNFQIDNKKDLLPGSFVDIYIKTKSNKETVIVPNTALVEEYGNYFALVQLNPEMFEKREVMIGLSDGLYTEVVSGITETERIVSKGAVIVKLAAVSNSLDPHAGHVH